MDTTKSDFHVKENEKPYKQVSPYFATREEAEQYIDDNKLEDVSVSYSLAVNVNLF